MVEETFVDLQVSPSVSSFSGWRCMICGEILDPIILQNRTRHPEPQYGRARTNKGGINGEQVVTENQFIQDSRVDGLMLKGVFC